MRKRFIICLLLMLVIFIAFILIKESAKKLNVNSYNNSINITL